MTRLVGGPVRFMPITDFRSEAPARSEIIHSAASRARLIEELASGQAMDDRPIGGRNPQDETGADLSGPPWGSAVYHPVATSGGRGATGSITGDRQAIENITATPRLVGPFVFWNRPHAKLPHPYIAPYELLFLVFRAYSIGGSTTLTVRLNTHALSGRVLGELSQDFTVTSTEATFESTTAWFDGMPGWRTAVSMLVSATPDDVMVTSWSIVQRRKRDWYSGP